MTRTSTRREFIRDMGLGATALPFILNLPSLGFANQNRRKQRLVVMFSPNGIVPNTFWPDQEGKLTTLKESCLVLLNQSRDPAHLRCTKATIGHERHRLQPELGHGPLPLHMDVRRFPAIGAEENETVNKEQFIIG